MARDPDDGRLWLLPHKGVSELVNDLNGQLMNFWRVLQDIDMFAQFKRGIEGVPLAFPEWNHAHEHCHGTDRIADAVAFFVNCRQSLAGRGDSFTAITRTRTRRQMNGNASEWIGAVDGLPAVHKRLRRVVIDNRPAIEVLKREDGLGTLHYCDPPYLGETRAARDIYDHEMTCQDHSELLDTLKQVKGKVVLSGYRSRLYDEVLANWTRHDFDLPNNAASGKDKRRMTECLWINFEPSQMKLRLGIA